MHTTRERADLLETLDKHRGFLRFTVKGLSDAQAADHPTASVLCLGGLIKHVAEAESGWVDFILNGPAAMTSSYRRVVEPRGAPTTGRRSSRWPRARPWPERSSTMTRWRAAPTRSSPDCPTSTTGIPFPWRRGSSGAVTGRPDAVILHLIAETAQHAGHADILRETIDGSKTMG